MESFAIGLLIGITLGVWLSVAVLYLAPVRHKAAATSPQLANGPQEQIVVPPAPRASSGSAPAAERTRQTVTGDLRSVDLRLSGADASQLKELDQQLMVMTKGDAEMAGRLLKYERDRAPDVSLATLYENAIFHWRRDNQSL